ncbi:SIR2 family NAD-dependent protein deacylase [Paludisphaera mucosa]|uniref:protein acetyllysine N-acetyltransferase n=1 Tax=Paludisphaera mucosa TaxID=3030827 RepID=A0ABT6FK28_9BACT|nr:Sir2 family NAD-dependent protein deacetylase [Paludisphaera mucosa]MDG3007935.1 Sir2 family NAD-dependent protein deacetylase [Paludisphaera mucosa]
MDPTPEPRRAAEAVSRADAILIGAGAGMGVDSGLPDFRGRQGFWQAYPPYAKLGLDFVALASPRWFRQDPGLAWGFYGHRLELYRATRPHKGFAILKRWADRAPQGGFVYTSNVDGQFQRAGFPVDRIHEVHGAIDFLQCLDECGVGIFPAEGQAATIDPETMRAVGDLPRCPRCGTLARPNILMFGDGGWDGSASDAQAARLRAWLKGLAEAQARLVVVECGAGTAIPTVRGFCERAAHGFSATLIRINPREPLAPPGSIAIAADALETLAAINAFMQL